MCITVLYLFLKTVLRCLVYKVISKYTKMYLKYLYFILQLYYIYT